MAPSGGTRAKSAMQQPINPAVSSSTPDSQNRLDGLPPELREIITDFLTPDNIMIALCDWGPKYKRAKRNKEAKDAKGKEDKEDNCDVEDDEGFDEDGDPAPRFHPFEVPGTPEPRRLQNPSHRSLIEQRGRVKYQIYFPDLQAQTGTRSRSKKIPKPNWASVLPGYNLLLVKKQFYNEVAPHLYKACTFHVENGRVAKAFLDHTSAENLKCIQNLEVYLESAHNSDWNAVERKGSVWVAAFDQPERFANRLVTLMPDVKELRVQLFKLIDLENPGFALRSAGTEKALVRLGKLKHVEDVALEVHQWDRRVSPRNRNWEVVPWIGWCKISAREGLTARALAEIIKTGDRGVLDKARAAWEEDQTGSTG